MRRPLTLFLLFVLAYVGTLGWAWLPRTPTHEELVGYAGKLVYLMEWVRQPGEPSWWVPGYLGGFSAAAIVGYIFGLLPFALAALVFPPIVALKITGLVFLAGGAVAAWAFGRRLTGSPWTACAIGIGYLLSPQLLLRLGWQEHMTIVIAYPLVPLTFLAMLRVAERGARVDALLLAMAFSATMLTWSKIGATLLVPLAGFAVWLFATRQETRANLLRGAVWTIVFGIPLAIIPLLPLVREFGFMTIFEFRPFESWQHTYSVKSLTSWIDSGSLFRKLPPIFAIDRGGYYLGIPGLVAVFWLVFHQWTQRRWTAELRSARAFLALTLLVFWLSFGPRSVLSGHFQLLEQSLNFPDWGIIAHWLILGGTGALLYWLLPVRVRHPLAFLALFGIFLLVPGFRIIEKFPLFDSLRAPDSFWILNGALCWSVAAGIAVAWVIRSFRHVAARVVISLAVLAVAIWTTIPYSKYFWKDGLPQALYDDFHAATDFLKSAQPAGRLLSLSGRYFDLQLPALTGHPLVSEAAHHNFMLRDFARLETAARASASDMLAFLQLAGVSHIIIDRQDHDVPQQQQLWFRSLLPVAFENDFFTILQNEKALYPAFLASVVRPAQPELPQYLDALQFASKGILSLPPGEGGEQGSPAPFQRITPNGPATSAVASFAVTGSSGWLTLSEAWHPDWTASIDGTPARVTRVAGAFPGVAIPTGAREVTFRFQPPAWYTLCLAIGGGSWVLSLAWLALVPVLPARIRAKWNASRTMPSSSNPVTIDRAPIERPLVIIPTYNERETITELLDRVLTLPSTEILLVDDASSDGTAQMVKSHAEFGRRIHLLERPSKLGLGSAYRDGFRWAFDHGHDACIEIDADLSHDPQDIAKLLQALQHGADAAIGSRYLNGVRVINWPQHRLALSIGASHFVHLLTGLPLTDATSGFKAIRTSALRALDWSELHADGYGFQVELHWLLWQSGFRLVEIPIVFTERRSGKTKMSLGIAVEAARRVCELALHPRKPAEVHS